MTESITIEITESGTTDTILINEAARGPAGPSGPSSQPPTGTGIVTVTNGVFDDPAALQTSRTPDSGGTMVIQWTPGGIVQANSVQVNSGAQGSVFITTDPTITNYMVGLPHANGTIALTSQADGSITPFDVVGLDPTSTAAASMRTALGIPTYADLTEANAALNSGDIYFDTALGVLRSATA